MSTNQGENSDSEQAKGAFNDAVEKGDFSNISHLVSATVQTALDEAKRAIEEATAAGAQKTKEKVMQQQAQDAPTQRSLFVCRANCTDFGTSGRRNTY